MSAAFFPPVTEAWKKAQVTDGDVPCKDFLDAAEAFIPLFDRLGTVFTPVKSDVGGNVVKLRQAHKANPTVSLKKLVLDEVAAGKTKDKNSASIALLWFKRAMQFIFAMLKKVSAGEDANKAAKSAYEETLSHYHGFIVKKSFQVALMAAPGSESMLKALGQDKVISSGARGVFDWDEQDQTMREMQEWVSAASPILDFIHEFLDKNQLDDKSKV